MKIQQPPITKIPHLDAWLQRLTKQLLPVITSPLSIPHSAFVPEKETCDWSFSLGALINRTSLTSQYYYAPVILPDGVTITKLTLYGDRDDASATMVVILVRSDMAGSTLSLATVSADWTSGYSSKYDDTVGYVVDNDTYSYLLQLQLDPNDAVTDVRCSGVKIEFSN